jgi:16S rRNA C967 or C1407 C5-methylase (RsmB/RsmF family)
LAPRCALETRAAWDSRIGASADGIARRHRGYRYPGGALIYSTCSLQPEEDTHKVQAVLLRHPAFPRVQADLAFFPTETGGDAGSVAILRSN